MKMTPFERPLYITRPILPDLDVYREKLSEIWAKQWLTNNGDQHQLLEERLCLTLKVPNLTLFNNGTTALLIALRCLGLSGEVITTPFTFSATPHVLSWHSICPVFCDIDPLTMNIDTERIEAAITTRTTGILAVHVFGVPCDVGNIQQIANKYHLKVIYDAAHAFGTELNGIGIGNFGDISMFSFHATKLFHTAEGGALTYRDLTLKAKLNLARNFGIKNADEVVMAGINGKMNELQAALGLSVLGLIEEETEKRRQLAATYKQCLMNIPGITYLTDSPGVSYNYQYFVIRIDKKEFGLSRDEVHERFRIYNVFTRKYFFPLCSDYKHYVDLPSSQPNNLPIAHKVVNEVLCLPFYGGLSIAEVEKICYLLKSFR